MCRLILAESLTVHYTTHGSCVSLLLFLFFIQRAAGPGGGDGAGHRHVLPLPAGEGHEELPAAARGVSSSLFTLLYPR